MTALKIAADNEAPSAEMYSVTPAIAKRWLARNVRNRTIRPGIAEAYARDMAAGNWRLTGEAVKFDTNGAMIDGQHRLTAIVLSRTTVTLLVVRGLEPESQSVMDSGAKRSASDALTLNGRKNASILAATARLALREPAAGYAAERITNPTHSEIADFIAEYPQIERAAEMAGHYYPAFDAPPSVLGICWMRFSEIDLEATVQFFSAIADVRTDGAGDPRAALVKRLQNARRNKERIEQPVYLSMIFRTWNAWRAGKSLTKLQGETRGQIVKTPDRLR